MEVFELFSVEFAVPDREQGIADSYEGPHLPADDAFKDLPTLSLWPPSWRKSQKNFSYENFWAGPYPGGVGSPKMMCQTPSEGKDFCDRIFEKMSARDVQSRGA